jgi:hypothetical protein
MSFNRSAKTGAVYPRRRFIINRWDYIIRTDFIARV